MSHGVAIVDRAGVVFLVGCVASQPGWGAWLNVVHGYATISKWITCGTRAGNSLGLPG